MTGRDGGDNIMASSPEVVIASVALIEALRMSNCLWADALTEHVPSFDHEIWVVRICKQPATAINN
jgi:hypothetical protein